MPSADVFKEQFLKETRTTQDARDKALIDWDVLQAIAEHHNKNKGILSDTAEAFVRVIQKMDSVHLVSHRVKDTWHLVDKIIRKRSEGSEKYLAIDAQNYTEVITDLVGLRVLHLFKFDLYSIHAQFIEKLVIQGRPTINIRKGDDDSPAFGAKVEELGMDVHVHDAGYRSVHYIAESQMTRSKIFLEIQVRTIYEEAWSEIDHSMNYPHKADGLISNLLLVLNRLSGSADEMGAYMQQLREHLLAKEIVIADANKKRDEAIAKMKDQAKAIQSVIDDKEALKRRVDSLVDQLDSFERLDANKAAETSVGAGDSYNYLKSLNEAAGFSSLVEQARKSAMPDFWSSTNESAAVKALTAPGGLLAPSLLTQLKELEDANKLEKLLKQYNPKFL